MIVISNCSWKYITMQLYPIVIILQLHLNLTILQLHPIVIILQLYQIVIVVILQLHPIAILIILQSHLIVIVIILQLYLIVIVIISQLHLIVTVIRLQLHTWQITMFALENTFLFVFETVSKIRIWKKIVTTNHLESHISAYNLYFLSLIHNIYFFSFSSAFYNMVMNSKMNGQLPVFNSEGSLS